MSRAKLHLPKLSVAAALLLSVGAMACSDKRDDDANNRTTAAVDTPATTTSTQGGTVEQSNPNPNTSTTTTSSSTTRRSSRSSSTPADRYDPYAVDPAAPRQEANVDVAVAPAPTERPADASKADVQVRAEVRRDDVTDPLTETPVTARADVSTTTPTTPTTTVTTTTPVTPTTPTATVTTTTPTRPGTTVDVTATPPVDPKVPVTRADDDADPTATPITTPAATPSPTPVKSGVLNDAHLFNIILLANAGDSARTAAALGTSTPNPKVVATVVNPVTPVTIQPKGEVAVTTPAPTGEVRVVTRSEGGTVTRGETSALFPLGEDCYWPTMNRHDDPKLKPECEDNPVEGPVMYSPAPVPTTTVTPAETIREGQPQPMTPKADYGVSATGATTVTAEQVRQLALQMQRDHTELNSRTATVLQRLNVAPTESAVSVEVYNRNQRAAEMTLAAGNERAWLENEVRLHEQSLVTVNDRLLPSANDAELRQVLDEQKRLIEQHLTHMRQLLGTAGTAIVPRDSVNHDNHMLPPDSMRMRTDTVQLRYDPNPPRPDTTRSRPVPPRDPYMMW